MMMVVIMARVAMSMFVMQCHRKLQRPEASIRWVYEPSSDWKVKQKNSEGGPQLKEAAFYRDANGGVTFRKTESIM